MSKKIKLLQTNRSFGSIEGNDAAPESRLIDLVWTTGAKGMRSTRDGFQYFEELSLDQSAIDTSRMIGNPLLASHDTNNLDSVIGVIESVTVDSVRGEGRAQVRFAKDEYSERVFQKVKDKIIRNVSVGYRIDAVKDVTRQGDDVPTYRAEKWTPYEISLVSIGFDKDAQIRSEDVSAEIEIEVAEKLIEENEIANVVEASAELPTIIEDTRTMLTDDQKKELALAAKLEEKSRQSDIRSAVRAAKLEETYADELIKQDISADQARKMVFEQMASAQPAPASTSVRIEIVADEGDKKRQGLADSLLHRIDSVNFSVTEQSKSFHGKRLLRSLEEIFPRNNYESDSAYAVRAMSSSDLSGLLANVAGKSLQKRYELAPRTATKWAKQDTLSDYKLHTQYRMGDFASLLERQESGEYKHASVGEEKETVQLKDYGRMYEFTARMLVNDDLKALQVLASESGIAAARLENKLCYDVLAANAAMGDGTAVFHASHSNLSTGALAEASISAMWTAMRKQKSVGGLDTLNLTPSLLICGPSTEVAARKFFTAIAPSQTSNVNIFQNSMEVIVDAAISGTEFYAMANPSQIDTVTLFKLEGQEGPQVSSRVKFENDAFQLKVSHTAAAKAIDYRGMQKSTGV